MKIIKINTDHYVVVDDSEIKEGDWFIGSDNKILLCKKTILGLLYSENDYGRNKNGCKKITHSTTTANLDVYSQTPIGLSLCEVKELIGEVDVEKKAYEYAINDFDDYAFCGYVEGYNQALEDNKEKKYTEEDMRKAFEYGKTLDGYDWFGDLLESLQPKTEWEVQIVDGKLKLKL